MARPATGQVIVDERGSSARFSLRFRAYGKREFVPLGSVADGWSRERADEELKNVLAQVRLGIWRPRDREPLPAPAEPEDPTFHEFASQWFEDNKAQWRPKTRVDYAWQLSSHLLPFFGAYRLSQITKKKVDDYKKAKLRESQEVAARIKAGNARMIEIEDRNNRRHLHRERPLSATSINKTITRLAQILETAVDYDEYELVTTNVARGKQRRVNAAKPKPVWLDRAVHIQALVDAGAALDKQARKDRQHVPREAILATLVFAGLRIGELLDLRWRDVDLSGGGAHGCGRLHVADSKTDAGVRRVDVVPALAGILSRLPRRGPDSLVFATSSGKRQGESNIRRRILAPAIAFADKQLGRAGEVPLPERITPHKLRHSFASLLVALGEDPAYVMRQLGHTDPAFTLRVYTHAMDRDAGEKEALRELVGAEFGQRMGSNVVPVAFGAAGGARRA